MHTFRRACSTDAHVQLQCCGLQTGCVTSASGCAAEYICKLCKFEHSTQLLTFIYDIFEASKHGRPPGWQDSYGFGIDALIECVCRLRVALV